MTSITSKLLRTLPLWLCLPILTHPARAESNAPTFLAHSGLGASDASADVNIALHKAVLSGAIRYLDTDGTQHPENAFDGNDNTATGNAGNVTVDLGAVYVVDRVVVKFTSTPTKYEVAWSPYLGAGDLPPTYDLASGLGHVPDSETANQEYRDLAWLNGVQPIDDRKMPAQPARFLNFHFHQIYSGTWSNVSINEIEVYGHPYVAAPADRAYLSRKQWTPTGFADAAPNGEGPTIHQAIDGQMTNPWRPQTNAAPGQWFQVDLGAPVTFDSIDVLFAIGAGAGIPGSMSIFASNDPVNWGDPIAKLDNGESAIGSFPTQNKRYLRVEQTANTGGWWQIDELNLLAAGVAGAGVPAPGGQAGSPGIGGTNAAVGGVGGVGAPVGVGGAVAVGVGGAGVEPPASTSGVGGSSATPAVPTTAGTAPTLAQAPKASSPSSSCALRPSQQSRGATVAWLLALVGLLRLRRQKHRAVATARTKPLSSVPRTSPSCGIV